MDTRREMAKLKQDFVDYKAEVLRSLDSRLEGVTVELKKLGKENHESRVALSEQ